MTTTLADLLPHLKGVRKSGDQYVALCPAHDDRRPSLSIAQGDDGHLLLYCHAGCTFEQIIAALPAGARGQGSGTSPWSLAPSPCFQPPPTPAPPDAAWQGRAWDRLRDAVDRLMSQEGERARAWLHGRGLTDATIAHAMLGYFPVDHWEQAYLWGLDGDDPIFIPRGILIPWLGLGSFWALEIRRPLTPAQAADGHPTYHSIRGSVKQLLGGVDDITPGKPVILVEGMFDRLSLHQAAADLVTPCALGTARGAQYAPWLLRLTTAPQVLVALDRDTAGDAAAPFWLDALGPRAVRWQPDPGFKDPNAMLQALGDSGLRAWVQAGLDLGARDQAPGASGSPTLAPDPQPLAPVPDTDPCAICGQPFDRYDPNGRPLCADHYAAWEQAEADWAQLGQRAKNDEGGTMNDEPQNSSLIAHRSSLPKLYPIPPRTKPQTCSCGATFYWVHDRQPGDAPQPGKAIPISVNPALHPKCKPPTRDTAGAGINHFADCPLRDGFRRRKPPALEHPLDPPQPQPATTEAA